MTIITRGMGAIIKGGKETLKGTGKKTKGYMEKDPIKSKKIPHDLSHWKGYLD